MLKQLGCCFNTHSMTGVDPSAQWLRKECDHCTSIGCDHAKCDPALVAEAAHFQCLSDNPWAESGGVLAAADPTAFVVLMRAVSPLHYAITWALFRIPRSISFNETVRRAEPHIESRMAAYSSRIAEMRSAFRSRQRFFEFCVSCGDDIFTLARAFGMNTTRLLEWLPEGEVRHPNPKFVVQGVQSVLFAPDQTLPTLLSLFSC